MSVALGDEAPLARDCFWSEPGLQEFVNSKNPGIHVSAKVSPEDFVVTELDRQGKLVVLDNYETPEERGCESLALATGSGKKSYRDPIIVEEVVPLQELVTSEQYKLIQEMAESYKSSPSPDPTSRINLGVLQDKWKRRLYAAVRLAFPVLVTRVIQDLQGERSMIVLHEPRYARLLEVLTPEEAEQVLLIANYMSSSQTLKLAYRPKEERTKIHCLLNFLFKSSIYTKFVSAEEQQKKDHPYRESQLEDDNPSSSIGYIEILHHKSKKKGKPKQEENQEEEPIVFTKFVLKKNGVESNFALKLVSDCVKCPVWDVRIHGQKDKKAITFQDVSVKNVEPARLLECRPKLLNYNIDIGNFRYAKYPVIIGAHSGNHFDIMLRDLAPRDGSSDEQLEGIVSAALDDIKENGFINYFGQQRYGVCDTLPLIGLAILRKDMKGAVLHALTRGPGASREIQELIEKECYLEAAELFSKKCTSERVILRSLAQSGSSSGDHKYSRALFRVPQEFRFFYLQSFCSLLWNHVASYRIREYGLKLVEGDLVVRGENGRWWEKSAQDVRLGSDWVHPVSAEDVSVGRYSVHDVVLPVVGSSVQLPSNKVAERIKEMMAVAGITFASFRITRLNLYYGGIYRRLLAHPRNLSWSIHQPQSSSLESLATATNHATTSTSGTGSHDHHMMLDRAVEGDQRPHSLVNNNPHLNLKFELGRGMYATMLLRELSRINLK